MDIITAIKSNNLDVTIKGTPENPLFQANDIGKLLEILTIRTSIRDYDDTEKVTVDIDTNGGPQKVSFLTTKGLRRVVCLSRKPKAISLAKMLNIDIHDSLYIPIETSFVNFIEHVYPNETILKQHDVNSYRLDVYFPEHKLAIECDEYFHNFNKKEDYERQKYITDFTGYTFLRFKQVKDKVDTFINLATLIKDINEFIYTKRSVD